MRISVVGPCASGKTALVDGLKRLGYDAHQALQEHSFAPAMWQKIGHPDILIFVDATHPVILQRHPTMWGGEAYWREQQHRLRHARAHCDLYIMTDHLTPSEVLARAVEFLGSRE